MDEPDGPIRRLFIWGFAYRPRQLGCQRQRDDGGSNREGAPRCSRAALLTATIMRPAQLPPDSAGAARRWYRNPRRGW